MFLGIGLASTLTSLVTEKQHPNLHICCAALTFATMMAMCVVWCITISHRGLRSELLMFVTLIYILHGVLLAHEMYHEHMTGVGLYEFICLLLGFYIIFMVNAAMVYHGIAHGRRKVLLLTNG
jgi:predicted neutral ceramidase superfamily lipid hydrolase